VLGGFGLGEEDWKQELRGRGENQEEGLGRGLLFEQRESWDMR
jgi:hypothetical protein